MSTQSRNVVMIGSGVRGRLQVPIDDPEVEIQGFLGSSLRRVEAEGFLNLKP